MLAGFEQSHRPGLEELHDVDGAGAVVDGDPGEAEANLHGGSEAPAARVVGAWLPDSHGAGRSRADP